MDTQSFISDLKTHTQPENQGLMERYMKNKFRFLGIRTPERRLLSRDYLKASKKKAQRQKSIDWKAIQILWQAPEREFQYIAADALKNQSSFLSPADLPQLEKLITEKSWWDTVDTLAKLVGDIVQKDSALEETMLNWSRSENLWIRRSALLHQLTFKEETDTRLLEDIILNNLQSEEFFIDKAIGWALREYSKTSPDWVRIFLKDHKENLSNLSKREASKHL